MARCTSPFFNDQIIFCIDSLTIVAGDKMFNISRSLRTGWPPSEYLDIARGNLEIGAVRGADYADLDEQINDCDEKGALLPAPSLELQPHVLATPPPFPAVRLLGMLLRACAATPVEKGPLHLNCCSSTRTLFQAIAQLLSLFRLFPSTAQRGRIKEQS